jgi:putative ABC transport system permease protein
VGFWSTLQLAFGSLWKHKVRTLINWLGVLIGVASLILTDAVAGGAKSSIQARLDEMGKDLIFVWGGQRQRAGVSVWTDLSENDLEVMRRQPFLDGVAPVVEGQVVAISSTANYSCEFRGTTGNYLGIKNFKLALGRNFSEEEARAGTTVVVLGKAVRDKLFGSANPLNATVRLGKFAYKVVGVLEEVGNDKHQDSVAIMPVRTAQQRLKRTTYYDYALLRNRPMLPIEQSQQRVRLELLRANHLKDDDNDAFGATSSQEILKSYRQGSQTFGYLSLFTAAICLISGGMGITNTSLMSVRDRTREIGIRMAVGARSRDILLQFLMESLVVAVLGGLSGAALGVFLASWAAEVTSWPPIITARSIAFGLGSSVLVGLLAGMYPAVVASRLDPVVALARE